MTESAVGKKISDEVNMQELSKSFMDNNLRITGILILCLSTCLVLPKIAVSNLQAHGMSHDDSNGLTSANMNAQDLQDSYIPPDYGVPDSQHGSGTR